MATLDKRFNTHSATRVLPCLKALLCTLDPVVYGVAHQVNEGIGNRIAKQFVEAKVVANNFKIDFPGNQARCRSTSTHGALKRRSQRNHAQVNQIVFNAHETDSNLVV